MRSAATRLAASSSFGEDRNSIRRGTVELLQRVCRPRQEGPRRERTRELALWWRAGRPRDDV